MLKFLVGAGLILGLCSASASAQLTSLGVTTSGPASVEPSVAFDDKHDVYLHVWVENSVMNGRFVRFNGSFAGSAFDIPSVACRPRISYSIGTTDDVFFVLCATAARLVRYTGMGSSGAEIVGGVISIPSLGLGDVVFNSVTSQFAVVYECTGTRICLQHYTANGSPSGAATNPSAEQEGTSSTTGPRIAFDATHDRYLLTYHTRSLSSDFIMFSKTGRARLVDGVSGEPLFSGATFYQSVGRGVGEVMWWQAAYLPDLGHFLIAFTHDSLGPFLTMSGRRIDSFENLGGEFTFFRADNSLGAIAYDPVAHRAIVVGTNRASGSSSGSLKAAVVGGDGTLISTDHVIADGVTADEPSATAARGGQVGVAYSTDGSATLERFAFAPSDVRGRADLPARDTEVARSFNIEGWAVDLGAPAGSGVDALHVWAFPTSGASAVFLGAASTFAARSDVAAVFGSRFGASGFAMAGPSLGPGAYTLVAYARSAVSGDFTPVDSSAITVAPSLPLTMLDAPTSGLTTASSFVIDGWAVDRAAPLGSGPGVDVVHVYAYPAAGGAPTFVGAVGLGRNRPDVAGAFGSQFAASGFRLDGATLPPGHYQVVAYAHSTVTNTFNQSKSADLAITAPVPNPAMWVDMPASGAEPQQPFVVSGWAIDRGAPTGTGIDGIHVWAFPEGGGSPVFAGAATLGGSRSDVGAAFGAQFTSAGFTLNVSALPPGQTYTLGVYPHSTVSQSFNQSQSVTVTIK